MQVGFIHFDRSDQKKYLAVLDRMSEGGAIDELGIGRIRDWYSEHMFPGISSLHRHAKYLVVLPLLYRKAATFYYKNRKEVRPQIVKLEIELTKAMMRSARKEGRDISGITGNSQNLDKGKYVKYDPTYIYGTALHRYGILKHDDIEGIIFQQSKLNHEKPPRYEGTDEEQGDASLAPSVNLICDYAPLDLNDSWMTECSLRLSNNEATFLRDHMRDNTETEGTLLRFLLQHPGKFSSHLTADSFKDFSEAICDEADIPDQIKHTACMARYFSDLVRGLFYRFNMIYSKGADLDSDPDPQCEEDFWNWYETSFLKDYHLMKESLNGIYVSDRGASINFCKACIKYLEEKDFENMDRIIIARERSIKKSRSKLGTPGFESTIHDYDLSYRWETVSLMLREIEEGLGIWQGN